MNEKKQNKNRELAKGKVDLVLANLSPVYFFLACVSLCLMGLFVTFSVCCTQSSPAAGGQFFCLEQVEA